MYTCVLQLREGGNQNEGFVDPQFLFFMGKEKINEILRNLHNPFQLLQHYLSKMRKRQVVTTQMLLNNKCFDVLVLHDECG